jgi:hypothetical protein
VTGWNDQLGQIASALTEAAKHYGPAAADLAFAAVRVSCIGTLAVGGVLLFAVPGLAMLSRFFYRRTDAIGDDHFLTCAAGLASAACGVASTIILLNVWNWAGAFYPQLYIAHKLLNL